MAEAELLARNWQKNGQVGFLQLLSQLWTRPETIPGGEAPRVRLALGLYMSLELSSGDGAMPYWCQGFPANG